MAKYQIWTVRSFLTWLAICWLPFAGAIGLLVVKVGTAPAWGMAALLALSVGYVTLRRHQQGRQIRDGITTYLSRGTRVVNRAALPLGVRQLAAIDSGLHEARKRCQAYFSPGEANHTTIARAHDTAFLIVRDEVRNRHVKGNPKVGGLTYPDGTMVLEYHSDLYLLEDLACHEGMHAVLERLGFDMVDHHTTFAVLFHPIARRADHAW